MRNPVAQQRFDRAMQFLAESKEEPAREAARLEQVRLDKIAAEERAQKRFRELLFQRTLTASIAIALIAIAIGSVFVYKARRNVELAHLQQLHDAQIARAQSLEAARKAQRDQARAKKELVIVQGKQVEAARKLLKANRDAAGARRDADTARRNADAAVRNASAKATQIQASARRDLQQAATRLAIARTQQTIATKAKQRAEFEARVDSRAANARSVERAHGLAIALAAAGSSLDAYHEVPLPVLSTLHDLLVERLETRVLSAHRAPVTTVASCGRYVASGSEDATVRVWDLDGKPLAKLKDSQQGSVTSIAFSPDCKRIITASKSSSSEIIPSAILYDIAGNRIGNTMKHRSDVMAVIFSPDGQEAVTGSADGVKLWDLRQPQFTATTFPTPNPPSAGEITALAAARVGAVPASPWKFAAADFTTVRIWDGTGKPEPNPFKHHSIVTSLSFTGNDLVYTDLDGNGGWLDAYGGIAKGSFQVAPPSATAFFPKSRDIAIANGASVRLAVLSSGMPFWPHDFAAPPASVTAVTFTPAGEALVTGSDDGKVRLWRAEYDEAPTLAPAASTTLVRAACGRLAVHPVLTEARDTDRDARAAVVTCLKYGWTAAQTAAFFIEQGRALAAYGDVHEAASRFRLAIAQDPKLSFDPEAEAQRLAVLAAP